MDTTTPFTPDDDKNQSTPPLSTPYPMPAAKPLFSLAKGDFIFALFAVIIGIFTAVSGVFGGFSLGYFLSCLLMLALFAVYFTKGTTLRFFPVLCGVLALCDTAVFICTSNGGVRFFGAVASFLLGLMCFGELRNGKAQGNRETLGIFYTAGATIDNIDIAVKSLFVSGNGKQKVLGKALIGLLCAAPALLVIVPLLMSSDDAFQGMMRNLFSNSLSNILKAAFGLVLSVFILTYGLSLKKSRFAKMKTGNGTTLENVYIISFLSAISVIYLLYLFSQLAYFFSAFRGFLPNGQITYAQYARKGFFEMCAISVINLLITFLALVLAKKRDGKVCNAIKLLATFVAVFTLIIIATAISKMVLYIGAYGMTVRRLTTSAFMIFLAVVFVSVILRIYLTKVNIAKTALITAGCILLLLGTVNVNAVCAKYNYESYLSGRLTSVDVKAMYELGDEGIPYLVKLADHKKTSVSKQAKKYLAQAIIYDYFEDLDSKAVLSVDLLQSKEKDNDFSHFSIPKAAAYKSLYAFIEKDSDFTYHYKGFLTQIDG